MRRRYRSKRRGGSRVQTMRFQWYFDLNTQPDEMQIISVSAGGPDVVRRLLPFFTAYKYYKLGNISLKLVPASTLPVDPLGLSYEVNEPTVDPRDQLTPGLVRITNGEDILEDITGLGVAQQRQIYDSMMLGQRWYKWMLQRGVKRSASPRFWQIGQLKQDHFPGSIVNLPLRSYDSVLGEDKTVAGDVLSVASGARLNVTSETEASTTFGYNASTAKPYVSDPRGLFQTGMRGRLGWMPTDALQSFAFSPAGGFESRVSAMLANVPEVDCFKIILPAAYKTSYYYRAYVTETVYFREPVVNSYDESGYLALGDLDRFIRPGIEFKVPGESSEFENLQGVQNNGSGENSY